MKCNVLMILCVLFIINIILATKVDQKWYKSENNTLYYIDESYEFTWHEAFLKCSLMKMRLLTLETLEKHDEVAKILRDDHFAFKGPHLWIGATGVNKQFAWVANSQPVFTNNWLDAHNPDNWNREENCLHFWENTTQINDRKCDYKYGFICEENPNLNGVQAKYKNIVVNIIH